MTGSVLRVGIIGCGKIGAIRAHVATGHAASSVVAVADLDANRAAAVAVETGASACESWRDVVGRTDVEAIIVATTHDQLAPISIAALHAGKHVLCEKPMSTSSASAAAMRDVASNAGRVLRIGFNHRYHPALMRAHQMVRDGALGRLLCIRCRYGHGGRSGYEREWRMNPAQSGGGELLDQGIHAIDLFRWFVGDFVDVTGEIATWEWAAPVEDNAFALFRTAAGQIASLHASWTQWKNLFSFEVFGQSGAALVNGLGGSYGTETLTIQRRRLAGGTPEEELVEFPGPDESWTHEWSDFLSAVANRAARGASADDGVAALTLVEAVYQSSRRRSHVSLIDHPIAAVL